MYRLLDTPRPCSDLGDWKAAVGPYTDVVGWTYFGDLFLRDPGDGRFAVLAVAPRPRLVPLKYTDRDSFANVYLRREYIIDRVLRPADVGVLEGRLGVLGPDEVFIGEVIGGDDRNTEEGNTQDGNDDRLAAYRKGDVWAFAARTAAEHGVGEGSAVDRLFYRLQLGDDFRLWRLAADHILSELPGRTPGTLVEIGRCSHWLRPHQTRWTADGGFAWPSGYGSGQGGFSSKALPQFDWSMTLAWTGQAWQPPHDKRARPAVRVAIPARTWWHEQAAVHALWMTGREKERRFYGFRRKDGVWRCTAESDWNEDRQPASRARRRGRS